MLDDLDAKLFNYNDVITKACTDDFALVGGGAVFDDADNGQRVQCSLPNIAGFVTSPTARTADLLVQPVPNPVDKLPVGGYRAVDSIAPGALQHYGVLTGNVATTQLVRDESIEAIEQLGGTVVYSAEYDVVGGESNWAPFVDDMKTKGVKAFELVGEPTNLQQIQAAMVTAGYFPDVTIVNTNFYDSKYAQEGGANAKNTYIRSFFFPLELKDENPATAGLPRADAAVQPERQGRAARYPGHLGLAAVRAGRDRVRVAAHAAVPHRQGQGHQVDRRRPARPDDPGTNTPSACFLLMKLDGNKFVYDEKDTKPNQGKFNCNDNNVVTLTKSVPELTACSTFSS